MNTTFVIKANEIDEKLLNGIKSSYKNKQIEIIVREIDETEYLLTNASNRKRLLSAVKNIKLKKNLVEIKVSSLKKIR